MLIDCHLTLRSPMSPPGQLNSSTWTAEEGEEMENDSEDGAKDHNPKGESAALYGRAAQMPKEDTSS